MTVSELCFLTARELARRIREKDVSCVEAMEETQFGDSHGNNWINSTKVPWFLFSKHLSD